MFPEASLKTLRSDLFLEAQELDLIPNELAGIPLVGRRDSALRPISRVLSEDIWVLVNSIRNKQYIPRTILKNGKRSESFLVSQMAVTQPIQLAPSATSNISTISTTSDVSSISTASSTLAMSNVSTAPIMSNVSLVSTTLNGSALSVSNFRQQPSQPAQAISLLPSSQSSDSIRDSNDISQPSASHLLISHSLSPSQITLPSRSMVFD